MIRIGAFDYEPWQIVRENSLDYLIQERLKKNYDTVDHKKIDKETTKHDELWKDIYRIEKELKNVTGDIRAKGEKTLQSMKEMKKNLLTHINNLRMNKKTQDVNSYLLESEIIKNSKIILTTLSMSGIEMLDKLELKFSHLIIDEAWQSTEISTLIPFMQNIDKVILVGDHKQLPATVHSDNADKTRYNRSLYERLIDNDIPRFMLKIQYRMHSMIREFPSVQFYDNELIDSKSVYNIKQTDVSRLVFYDLEYSQEDKGREHSKSKSNTQEADFVANLFCETAEMLGNGNLCSGLEKTKMCIGIITPYKKQSKVIIESVQKHLTEKIGKKLPDNLSKFACIKKDGYELQMKQILEVNTVDSFQGREKDIVIISCVRASK